MSNLNSECFQLSFDVHIVYVGQKLWIFKKEIAALKRKLKSKKITLDFDSNAVDSLCDRASSEKMGARPLKRLIHSEIEDKIVDFYFKNPSDLEQKFHFYLKNNEIVFDLAWLII